MGVVLVGGVAWLAHVPLGAPASESRLRLDWAAAAHVEVCRDRSEEELLALPVHMRSPRECRDVRPAYRLTVEVDGVRRIDRQVAPHGVRGNRPLVVGEEIVVAPGRRRVTVAFVPSVRPEEADEAAGRLPRFEVEREVDLERGRVALLTLDPAGTLDWVTGQPPAKPASSDGG